MLISFSHRAFTLVELMIVIAIIGILIVIIGSFNVSGNISQQRVDNWAHEIADMIRDAQQDAVLGKVGGARKIVFKKGSNTSSYAYLLDRNQGKDSEDGNLSQGEVSWTSEEGFENDRNYSIEGIEIASAHLSVNFENTSEQLQWITIEELALEFEDSNKEIYFLPKVLQEGKSALSYRITLKYKDSYRYIYGSVYSGNVDIKNQKN